MFTIVKYYITTNNRERLYDKLIHFWGEQNDLL